jgi:hypothetical protein
MSHGMLGKDSYERLPQERKQQACEIAAPSHLMHEENAAAVNEAILGFLARHASQTVG